MSTVLRKIGALMLGAISIFGALLAIVWGMSGRGIEETIQHSREIERSFALASAFVESHKQTHGRLPNEAEFAAWANTQPDKAYSPKGMQLLLSEDRFPIEVIRQFGRPIQPGYVFQSWRGEWFEYFASWANASTLEFDAKKYYLFGSPVIDALAALSVSIALAFLARRIWPRSSNASPVMP
jgi:hypothetical protein